MCWGSAGVGCPATVSVGGASVGASGCERTAKTAANERERTKLWWHRGNVDAEPMGVKSLPLGPVLSGAVAAEGEETTARGGSCGRPVSLGIGAVCCEARAGERSRVSTDVWPPGVRLEAASGTGRFDGPSLEPQPDQSWMKIAAGAAAFGAADAGAAGHTTKWRPSCFSTQPAGRGASEWKSRRSSAVRAWAFNKKKSLMWQEVQKIKPLSSMRGTFPLEEAESAMKTPDMADEP